jgi:hypothetical protein
MAKSEGKLAKYKMVVPIRLRVNIHIHYYKNLCYVMLDLLSLFASEANALTFIESTS